MKKFRLNVKKGEKKYYQVFIFDNRLDMKLASKELLHSHNVSNLQAATHSFDAYRIINGEKKESNMIGIIMFYKNGFGHGVVTHEMAHAVNYYFLRNKVKFNIGGKHNDNWVEGDEAYAEILGYMVNQFWKKLGGKPGKERY